MQSAQNNPGERGFPLRFSVEAAHQEKITELNTAVEKKFGIKGSVGLVIRTLIECASPTPDFLGCMRQVYERDMASRKGRPAPRSMISLNLEVRQEENLNNLQATARANGVKGSAGTVVRTLLEMVSASTDFIQMMAKVAENEDTLRKIRRDRTGKTKPQ